MSARPGPSLARETGPQQDPAHTSRAQVAAVTGGIAPDDYVRAYWDWLLSLSGSSRKQTELAVSALQTALDTWQYATLAAAGAAPAPTDARFSDAAWNQWPYNVYARWFGSWAGWIREATTTVPGVGERNAQLLDFAGRRLLDALSPAHYLHTNPQLLAATRAEAGQNLVRGYRNWVEDVQRTLTSQRPAGSQAYEVGRNIAITPGRVVMRNELIELIQYTPQTPDVHAEPILITPAWIMKYYILDLSPANSLVRYLVGQGHTVFMISWKNPTAADRNLGMDDYLRLGCGAALDAVNAIVPKRKVHAVGYCIGGTLLAISAAVLAAQGEDRLASVTLLAGQTDFSEPGELSIFISPSQLAMLDAVMQEAGVLESERMAGAFALLRASDLLWAPALKTYVRGERDEPNDLMAWNSDGTRMPARMHSEYLHGLYLDNALARGELVVERQHVDLGRLRLPMFVVGTETDHVAPWRSVYKVRGLVKSTDYTFLLTNGGHNSGVVSGPVHPNRRHRVLNWTDATTMLSPDEWLSEAPVRVGSWWPTWQKWLVERSRAERVAALAMGDAAAGFSVLDDAPGQYVHG